MINILFASHNKGKYNELYEDFQSFGMNLIFDENFKSEIEESSDLLIENARAKAVDAATRYGMYALGDDSGFFVEALDYAPGVHSRRWFGRETSEDDDLRNEHLLELMKNVVNDEDRKAYLISRFALSDPEGNIIDEEVVKNEFTVATEMRGSNGFGYDKLMIPTASHIEKNIAESSLKVCGYLVNYKQDEKKTIAELSQDMKNAINNRGIIAKRIYQKGVLK